MEVAGGLEQGCSGKGGKLEWDSGSHMQDRGCRIRRWLLFRAWLRWKWEGEEVEEGSPESLLCLCLNSFWEGLAIDQDGHLGVGQEESVWDLLG